MCTQSGFAQSTALARDSVKAIRIKAQATKMAEAFTAQDYDTFFQYTYPPLLKAAGGKDGMAKSLQAALSKLKDDSIGFQSVSIGAPSSVYKAGTELHALIEQTIVLNVKGGTLTQQAWLLAVSDDNGNRWYFVDTAPLTNENISKAFPHFNKALVLPAKKKPVFTPAAE